MELDTNYQQGFMNAHCIHLVINLHGNPLIISEGEKIVDCISVTLKHALNGTLLN